MDIPDTLYDEFTLFFALLALNDKTREIHVVSGSATFILNDVITLSPQSFSLGTILDPNSDFFDPIKVREYNTLFGVCETGLMVNRCYKEGGESIIFVITACEAEVFIDSLSDKYGVETLSFFMRSMVDVVRAFVYEASIPVSSLVTRLKESSGFFY